jgi:hypothetical protein
MKKFGSLLFCILCLTSSLPAAGDDFISLFNGRNLDGWINVNCAPETWTVRDGMIICTGIPTGVLRTIKQYENYVLELEWRHMKKRGNAGLFIHSDPITAVGKPFTRSIEIQIMDGNAGDMFSIHGATMTPDKPHPKGWVRSFPSEDRMNPTGQWNHYRVESRNGTATLAVNGEIVTRGYHLNPRKGYICLESEGSEIHFRNIRIHELPGTPQDALRRNPPADVVAKKDQGFRCLYNGLDLRGFKQVPGNEGHWQAKNWILDYDGKSRAEDKNLWTEEEFSDFILIVDWRLPEKPTIENVPVVLPDGSEATDVTVAVMNAGDSGIYLRGSSKSQVNIWNWPVGSGEIWGYRTDMNMPPEVRRAGTPILNADKPVGEWNRFEITAIGDKVTIVLNGKTVIREARLPGMPERGPIALQHHGDRVQFANIYIKEL